MRYNEHLDLKGKHAFLSPSAYRWINYDPEKIMQLYSGKQAVDRGTRLHAIAAELISEKIKLPRTKTTFNMYVNDAIGFGLVPEQVLYYSNNCFGTADAISELDQVLSTKKLRVHDLKTGVTPAHMEQLLIYVALFCLEYLFKPSELADITCRLYQSDTIEEYHPTSEDIVPIMDAIISNDKLLRRADNGGITE